MILQDEDNRPTECLHPRGFDWRENLVIRTPEVAPALEVASQPFELL